MYLILYISHSCTGSLRAAALPDGKHYWVQLGTLRGGSAHVLSVGCTNTSVDAS